MADPYFGPKRLNSSTFEMKRKASFSKLDTGGLHRAVYMMYQQQGDNASAAGDSGSSSTTGGIKASMDRMWELMSKYLDTDVRTIQRSVVNHVEYTLAKNRFNLDKESCYRATAYSIRDRMLEMFNDTNQFFYQRNPKRCYYLSLEFLIGRAMQNALVNLDIEDNYRKALGELGCRMEELYEYEHDAALGNGGLGRLAACFLDSMATLNYAAWGYGIRYTYGIFEQKFLNGWQIEYPDYWLVQDNPWEICRHDVTYAVRFGGTIKEVTDNHGKRHVQWVGGQIVQAVAYDNIIPGFDTLNCINLRLWRAVPSKEFDFDSFNQGRYMEAIRDRQDAECISAVLYPNDNTDDGKALRLKQQYFFVCATIQDVLRRFKKNANHRWEDLPSKIAIQLNDTHPTIGIPELIRVLVDIEKVEWNLAVDVTRNVFHYTNHTVLPEALEKWDATLIERLLPRHIKIINELNFQFLNEVRTNWGDDFKRISRMSIYEDGFPKKIRMANLAVIGSRKVNGVAAIHSDLVKRDLFPEFVEWYRQKGQPEKFINVTNGVTPRRWIHNANRLLSDLISQWLGSDGWLKDLDMISGLLNSIDDEQFHKEWRDVKLKNKQRLANWVAHQDNGPKLDAEHMLFDVQVKRIHEYKRQHLNAFYMIHRYLTIKRMSPAQRSEMVPRATLVGGKAAPGYATAKVIIKMINCISNLVNNDPEVSPFFKVFFLPNYNVSSAQIIIPAADINQQISTAGTEASGTSNMKFVMNGAPIIGTWDGANIEIIEEGGMDTAFVFGARENQVKGLRKRAAESGNYPVDGRLWEVFQFIRSGKLTMGDHDAQTQISGLVERLLNNGEGANGDFYLVIHDFPDFVRAQEKVDATYKDQEKWTRLAIKAAASMGKFSTDRTIRDYAENLWGLEAAERPAPTQDQFRRLASGIGLGSTGATTPLTKPEPTSHSTKPALAKPIASKPNTVSSGNAPEPECVTPTGPDSHAASGAQSSAVPTSATTASQQKTAEPKAPVAVVNQPAAVPPAVKASSAVPAAAVSGGVKNESK